MTFNIKRFAAKSLEHPKRAAPAAKKDRHFGCPTSWLLRVLPAVKTAKQLTVAIYIWKQHVIRGHRKTFDMPNGELRKLGISRNTKYRALELLTKAGVIAAAQTGNGALSITIL
jgi:hypothetical protein